MNTLIWFVIIIMLIYTVGFAITLWKEKNKVGSIVVFILAILIVILPFYSVFRAI